MYLLVVEFRAGVIQLWTGLYSSARRTFFTAGHCLPRMESGHCIAFSLVRRVWRPCRKVLPETMQDCFGSAQDRRIKVSLRHARPEDKRSERLHGTQAADGSRCMLPQRTRKHGLRPMESTMGSRLLRQGKDYHTPAASRMCISSRLRKRGERHRCRRQRQQFARSPYTARSRYSRWCEPPIPRRAWRFP